MTNQQIVKILNKKPIFVYEEGEYALALFNFMNLKLTHKVRFENYHRMQELEEIVKKEGDELQIIITTKNTPRPIEIAPPMDTE